MVSFYSPLKGTAENLHIFRAFIVCVKHKKVNPLAKIDGLWYDDKEVFPMKSTKFWLLVVGIVLAVAAAASAAIFSNKLGDATALIYQDGVCLCTIDLSQVGEPYSFTVEWEDGCNVVEVERGRIRVSEADCPDQVCVRQGWISNSVAPIACLPHKLVIRLVSSSDSVVDGVVG